MELSSLDEVLPRSSKVTKCQPSVWREFFVTTSLKQIQQQDFEEEFTFKLTVERLVHVNGSGFATD